MTSKGKSAKTVGQASSRAFRSKDDAPGYPLQGTELDADLADVLDLSETKRLLFIRTLLSALSREVKKGTMALKKGVSVEKEMRDLRRLIRTPVDRYLRLDELTFETNVLMVGAPGHSHVSWSRHEMWKMATSFGDLERDILRQDDSLTARLSKLLDNSDATKQAFRKHVRVLPAIYKYLGTHYGSNGAFPAFHARFLADRYLPSDSQLPPPEGWDAIGPLWKPFVVVDPCAGWGGRMLGTLCVPRKGHVIYVGIDPNIRNQRAYERLDQRITDWLGNELESARSGFVVSQRFEEWVSPKRTVERAPRAGQAAFWPEGVDVVMTSPPYFDAENYAPRDRAQSANRYNTYRTWRMRFLQPMIEGAFRLLKPGGFFVLNIANVRHAKTLEEDSVSLALKTGFKNHELFRLAMRIVPGAKEKTPVNPVKVDGVLWKSEPVFCFRKPAND